MSRTFEFIALGSIAEKVRDALCELIEVECNHDHKGKCSQDACEKPDHTVDLTNLDEVAVRIAEMIERGELS